MQKDHSPNYSRTPFWQEDPRLQETIPCETIDKLDSHVDIAIVGAGYSGLSAALTLARAGKQVIVLEADQIGSGCSGRNGGLIGASFHKLGISALKRLYGYDRMLQILNESIAGYRFLIDFIRKEQIDCELKLCGRFRGASHPKHYDAMAREIDILSRLLDLNADMIPKSEQHQEIGSDRYFGGALYHQDGNLHPALLVHGIARRVVESGALIFTDARVSSIVKNRKSFQININDQKLHANDVIIATNGYTGDEFKSFKRRLLPIRSSMIATEELDTTVIRSLSPNLRSHVGTERLVQYYRPSPDGRRMLFGARSTVQADNPQRYMPYLRSCLVHIYPQLADAEITHAWSGVVAYTLDHIPHIGVHNGMHYAMGYCGSGVARATYFGNKIALKLLGDDEGRTVFDDLPFRGHPLYNGNPWFMPAIMRWYGLADKMGW